MSDTPSAQETRLMEIAELATPIRLPMVKVERHPDNPRVHSVHQINELKESLLEHGFVAGSMVVQESRTRLVKGHGIYEALLELHCQFADFILQDMSDEEALIFLMRDNRLSDLSSWHPTKFMKNVTALKSMNVKMGRIGFKMKQIEAMIPKDVDLDPDALDQDVGTGKSSLVHLCPKCGFKFQAEDKS